MGPLSNPTKTQMFQYEFCARWLLFVLPDPSFSVLCCILNYMLALWFQTGGVCKEVRREEESKAGVFIPVAVSLMVAQLHSLTGL